MYTIKVSVLIDRCLLCHCQETWDPRKNLVAQKSEEGTIPNIPLNPSVVIWVCLAAVSASSYWVGGAWGAVELAIWSWYFCVHMHPTSAEKKTEIHFILIHFSETTTTTTRNGGSCYDLWQLLRIQAHAVMVAGSTHRLWFIPCSVFRMRVGTCTCMSISLTSERL